MSVRERDERGVVEIKLGSLHDLGSLGITLQKQTVLPRHFT